MAAGSCSRASRPPRTRRPPTPGRAWIPMAAWRRGRSRLRSASAMSTTGCMWSRACRGGGKSRSGRTGNSSMACSRRAAWGSAAGASTPRGREITLWQDWQLLNGLFEARGLGLGGWSLNAHHVYEPIGRTLYLGEGDRRVTEAFGQVVTTAAGTGVAGFSGDGGPATAAQLNVPYGVAVAPDGSLYVAEHGIFPSNGTGQRVRKVTTDGTITTVAGTGAWGFSGDGGPATAATLSSPTGVAVGPDGSLYIADSQAHRIRRVGL